MEPLEGSGWRWGAAGQQEELTYKEKKELKLPIERLVARLYKREAFGEEVVVEVIRSVRRRRNMLPW